MFHNANSVTDENPGEKVTEGKPESVPTNKPQATSFQKELVEISVENTQLKKYNSNLQEQVNKYAILLSEEKEEKK